MSDTTCYTALMQRSNSTIIKGAHKSVVVETVGEKEEEESKTQ